MMTTTTIDRWRTLGRLTRQLAALVASAAVLDQRHKQTARLHWRDAVAVDDAITQIGRDIDQQITSLTVEQLVSELQAKIADEYNDGRRKKKIG